MAASLGLLGMLISWPGLPERFLGAEGFMPHGHCYLWDPALIRLHLLTDLSIGMAYVAISLTLVYLVYKTRQEIPFSWMFLAFGLFIISCGGTHFMEVWTLWRPDYWAAGGLKLVTALASVGTAVILPTLIKPARNLLEASRLKRAEAAQLLMAAIVESSDDAIFSKTLDSVITTWNKGAERIYGYAAEEIVGKPISLLFPTERRDEVARIMKQIKRGESLDHYETTRRTKDGRLLDVSLTISPIKNTEGRLIGAATVARDMSEHKRAERRLQLVVEAAPNAMILVGKDGAIALANAQTEVLFGYARRELLGKSIELLVPERYRGRHPGYREAFFKEPAARPMGAGRDLFGRRKDGTEVPIEIGLSPIETPEGLFTLAAIVDITERKQAENLRTAKEAIEAVTREMETFSYSCAHDLRAPLRKIAGFGQLLEKDPSGNLSAQGREYLQRIQHNVLQMDGIIAGLLRLSRVLQQEPKNESVNLSALAEGIADELRKAQPERRVEFVVTDGVKAQGDPEFAQIILRNLLENSWKFTARHPRAKIEFGSMKEGGETVYYVRDDGAGFDMAHADKLFGAFKRLHAPGEFPGAGIGLATVQRVVRRHGGRIWGEGQVERGATFYFTLGRPAPS